MEKIESTEVLDAPVNERRVYELGYLIIPLVSEENLGALVSALKSLIENSGGIVIGDEWPKMRNLAYDMSKKIETTKHTFDTAYFSWMKFEAEPSAVALIKEGATKMENVLRFMIIQTVRENVTKRVSPAARAAKAEGGEEVKGEDAKVGVSEEELDKTIQELVVE
jgi:small subunit ribosomal protein S6